MVDQVTPLMGYNIMSTKNRKSMMRLERLTNFRFLYVVPFKLLALMSCSPVYWDPASSFWGVGFWELGEGVVSSTDHSVWLIYMYENGIEYNFGYS